MLDRVAQGAEQRGQHRADRDQAVNAVDAGDLMHPLAQHHLVENQEADREEQRTHQHGSVTPPPDEESAGLHPGLGQQRAVALRAATSLGPASASAP